MTKIPKRGNIIAQAAVMCKGGVHEKSKSAKRQNSKRKLRNEVNNYMAAKDGSYSEERGFIDRLRTLATLIFQAHTVNLVSTST